MRVSRLLQGSNCLKTRYCSRYIRYNLGREGPLGLQVPSLIAEGQVLIRSPRSPISQQRVIGEVRSGQDTVSLSETAKTDSGNGRERAVVRTCRR